MTVAQSIPRETRPAGVAVPPLENGDRLTRADFERRYEAMPQVKKHQADRAQDVSRRACEQLCVELCFRAHEL